MNHRDITPLPDNHNNNPIPDNQPTLLWHDYESWGANPKKDHPSQFAAVRTDLDLNPVGNPINWMCQIPNDYLPHPQACLVTGITPQRSLRDGILETEFIGKIHQQMSQPQTCVVGYNNIRFDDELSRFSFYRNFLDPYGREWQNGNTRWDIIDMVRACYALRPDGINWVYDDDGVPRFKLELLSKANGIGHDSAHDALSDVYATIGLAKLIKTQQPKLYQYLFDLRFKKNVAKYFNFARKAPLVHISSKLPASQGCCTWIVPVCPHPTNKNAVVCLDLTRSPQPLFDLTADELVAKLYVRSEDLDVGEERLPIKTVHLNKCPVVAPAKTLTEENAERLGINRDACLKNLKLIQQFTGLEQKLASLFEDSERETDDPDFALYSGGFLGPRDKQLSEQIRCCSPEKLADYDGQFEDPRLNTLLFRYRGRNFPQTLDASELQRWQTHRNFRLSDPAAPSDMQLEAFFYQLEELSIVHQNHPQNLRLLKDLYHYAQQL